MPSSNERRLRRSKVRRLLLRGLTAEEIFDSLGSEVSLQTIFEEIAAIKGIERRWWNENQKVESRFPRLLKRKLDELEEVERDGWFIAYEGEKSSDYRQRKIGLDIVLDSLKPQFVLLGFDKGSISDLELQEKARMLKEEIQNLKELTKSGRKK